MISPLAGIEARAAEDRDVAFESELDRAFARLASDPAGLERAAAAGALDEPQACAHPLGSGGGHGGVGPPAGRGRSLSPASRMLRRLKRAAGPKVRQVQHVAVERAGRTTEALATRAYVSADRVRRSAGPARVDRLSPHRRTLPSGGSRPGLGSASSTHRTEPALSEWIEAKTGQGAVDIAGGAALGDLARQRRGSLESLVISDLPDAVTPASARAIAHLASTRLAAGGVLVLVSSYPDGEADPVAVDLGAPRALLPVTWCHLLARRGFYDIEVREAAPPLPYAVSATRT